MVRSDDPDWSPFLYARRRNHYGCVLFLRSSVALLTSPLASQEAYERPRLSARLSLRHLTPGTCAHFAPSLSANVTHRRFSRLLCSAHPKFRSIFPEYASASMKDLPDMGVPKPSSSSADLTSASTTVPLVPTTVNHVPPLTRGSTGEVGRRPDRPPGGMRRWIGWAVLLLAISWATVKLLNS